MDPSEQQRQQDKRAAEDRDRQQRDDAVWAQQKNNADAQQAFRDAQIRASDENYRRIQDQDWVDNEKLRSVGQSAATNVIQESHFCHFRAGFPQEAPIGVENRISGHRVTFNSFTAASDPTFRTPTVTLERESTNPTIRYRPVALHDPDYMVYYRADLNVWTAMPKDDLLRVVLMVNNRRPPGWNEVSEFEFEEAFGKNGDLQVFRFEDRADSAVLAIISKSTKTIFYQKPGIDVRFQPSGRPLITLQDATVFYEYPGAAGYNFRKPDWKLASRLGITPDQIRIAAIGNNATKLPLVLANGYYLTRDPTRGKTQWALHAAPIVVPGEISTLRSTSPGPAGPKFETHYARSLPNDESPGWFEKHPPLFSTYLRRFEVNGRTFLAPEVSHIHSNVEMFWYDEAALEWRHAGRESLQELRACNGGKLPKQPFRKIRPFGLVGGQYVAIADSESGTILSVVDGVRVFQNGNGSYRIEFVDAQLFYGYPNAAAKGYVKPDPRTLSHFGLKESDLRVLAIVNRVTNRPIFIAPNFYLNFGVSRPIPPYYDLPTTPTWTLHAPASLSGLPTKGRRDGTNTQPYGVKR